MRASRGLRTAPRIRLLLAALLGTAVALAPATTSAHAGAPLAPHDLRGWHVWLPDPLVLAGVAGTGWLYWRGVRRLVARGARARRLWLPRSAAAGGGLLALIVALGSPLEPLSGALLWAHMVQHLLLLLAAAPLLVLAEPIPPLLRALPAPWRRLAGWVGRWRALRVVLAVAVALPVAWVLHGVALVGWHAPVLYEAAVASAPLHALEHACLLGTALLLWWAVLRRRGRMRVGYGASIVALFLMASLSAGLGALITFARSPWYPAYSPGEAGWGISPLMDQRAAGLIMWMPGGLVYAGAAVALLALWLRAVEREMQRRERPAPPGDPARQARTAQPPAALSFAGAGRRPAGGDDG